MIYFTSDLHISHDKDFIYKPRGFTNIYEHDQYLIDKWNSIIKPDDEVYILGDLMLGDLNYARKIFNQLSGFKHIILGNHDTDKKIELYKSLAGVLDINFANRVRLEGYNFYLSHYPTLTSNFDKDKPLKAKVINLCGHTHTSDKFEDASKGVIYHVELDAHDMKPVSIDDIIVDLKEYYGRRL